LVLVKHFKRNIDNHMANWCDEMTRSQAERAKRQFMEKINSHREVAGDSITLARFYQERFWDGANYKDELPKTKKGYRKVVLTPTQMAELKKYRFRS